MLDQATIDLYLGGIRRQLQNAQEIQNILQDPAGQLSKAAATQLIVNRNEHTDRAGFILYQLYINGIEKIDLGG